MNTADNLDLIQNIYNILDYSDKYADTAGSLYHYKTPDKPKDNNRALQDIELNNSSSFKYQSSLITTQSVAINASVNPQIPAAHRVWKNVKIPVPLVYLSIFFKSSEMPLINTKIFTELNRTKNCVISDSDGAATFQITKTEMYVPVVTLKTKQNIELKKLLSRTFTRSVIWNEYKSKIKTVTTGVGVANSDIIKFLLDSSCQGMSRLFVTGYPNNGQVRFGDLAAK